MQEGTVASLSLKASTPRFGGQRAGGARNRDAAKVTLGTMQQQLSTHINWGQFHLRQQLIFDICRNYRLIFSMTYRWGRYQQGE